MFSNYLPSTVYQGAYTFYNKEQLFSHVLQFNIFHHKLKFSFNFTINLYPFPQWHLRSPISPLPSEGIQYAVKPLLISGQGRLSWANTQPAVSEQFLIASCTVYLS